MKKLTLFLSIFAFLPTISVSAQILTNSPKPQIAVPPATKEVAAAQDVSLSPTEEQTSNKEVKIIVPAKLSKEQLAAEDDKLRENLRDTTKNDDRKSRVKFLEVNNYVDKVTLRRNLQKQGIGFKEAEQIAKQLPKPQINPDSNKQMNDYIFERADVKEFPQAVEDAVDDQ